MKKPEPKVRELLIITITLLLIAVILPAKPGQAADGAQNSPTTAIAPNGILISHINESKINLLNQVDGYSIILPATMKLVDTSSTIIRTVLEDEQRRLEIYKQPLAGRSANEYISYSNRFLDNTVDHITELQQRLQISGYPAQITQWSRGKLSGLSHDKNHYACIDIIVGDYVFTFFVKSDLPFYETGGYMDLVQDFSTFTPTAQPTPLKFKSTVNNSWNTETKEFYQEYFLADKHSSQPSWGIFEYSAPQDFAILDRLEEDLDHQFKFLLVYKDIQRNYPPAYVKHTLQDAYARGRTVELTLQTTPPAPGEGNMVYAILRGEYDPFLKSFAAETVEFAHPVLFRFCNEMNGDWCAYSAYHTSRDTELFKELYKYIYRIFEEAGADNVIWVFNPNEKSFPDYKWNHEQMYYPGDEYVDVVGLTGYNNGTYYNGEIWRSFTEIYDPLYRRMANLSEKPLMITEFSSSSVGGNKEQWVRNMFAHMNRYPRIKVAIWWNGCDWDKDGQIARPYFINESEELVQVFRDNLP